MRIGNWVLLSVSGGLVVMGVISFRPLVQAGKDALLAIRTGIQRKTGVKVRMRDGTRLNANTYLPRGHRETVPTILIRTTYAGIDFSRIESFVSNGYAVVHESVRGRYDSEGEYLSPYYRTKEDGWDTIDWIVKQPWSNGRVGTFGCSYLGESQIMLASARHPNHLAMIASGAGGAIGKAKGNFGYFGVFENGVLNYASALGWFTSHGRSDQRIPSVPEDYQERLRKFLPSLPLSDVGQRIVGRQTGFDDFLAHGLTDRWWDEQGYITDNDRFGTATLHINSWYDQTVQGTFALAELMQENAESPRAHAQHVLIDPGLHCHIDDNRAGRLKVGEMDFDYTPIDFGQLYVDWFDHWLKNSPTPVPPKFRFFLIHANEWRSSETWPPSESEMKEFYLSKGRLTQLPNLTSAVFDYAYDPMNPVPSLGGALCCTANDNDLAGAVDQSRIRAREDVLHFESDVLEDSLDVIGNPAVRLFISTDGVDTDFTAKLLDIYPDGRAFNIQDGVARLRYRHGVERPELAIPGEVYEVVINLRPVAYRMMPGHRLGLHVSSSNFPRLARNLNTGKHEYQSSDWRVAHNKVFVGEGRLSAISLPVASKHRLPSAHH